MIEIDGEEFDSVSEMIRKIEYYKCAVTQWKWNEMLNKLNRKTKSLNQAYNEGEFDE